MKKAILIFTFLAFVFTINAQPPKNGFLKPVAKTMFSQRGDKSITPSVWLFRPTVEISALQLVYNKDSKSFDASSLQSAGFGVGYQHFVEANGLPVSNYGFNALVLFNAVPTETNGAQISGAITISAMQFINLGAGYNLGAKKFFLLAGITYNFN